MKSKNMIVVLAASLFTLAAQATSPALDTTVRSDVPAKNLEEVLKGISESKLGGCTVKYNVTGDVVTVNAKFLAKDVLVAVRAPGRISTTTLRDGDSARKAVFTSAPNADQATELANADQVVKIDYQGSKILRLTVSKIDLSTGLAIPESTVKCTDFWATNKL